jgi:hypothetical protein
MRAFAERQQYYMLPRQTARRAADYLSYYFAGAGDVNYVDTTHPSSNALIMYYNVGGILTQASYNNLTGTSEGPTNAPRVIPANPPLIPTPIASTNFGDVGTDIITIVAPFDAGRYKVFAPFPALGPNADLWLNFRVGCTAKPSVAAPSDAENLKQFQAATGFDGKQSALLMLVDKNGRWSYVRIPGASYPAISNCADMTGGKNINVKADTGGALSAVPAPPNGAATLVDQVYLITGLQVISFRVLTDSVDGIPKLQQKLGLFDPKADNPGTAFTNVLENVEDLQIAYMYSDGGIWNTKSQTPAAANGVPIQAGPSASPTPLDISNVIGVRFSVTGRSPFLPLASQKLTNIDVKGSLATTVSQHFRPASEDHLPTDPPQYDQFDHYRASATIMLRSRMPRG